MKRAMKWLGIIALCVIGLILLLNQGGSPFFWLFVVMAYIAYDQAQRVDFLRKRMDDDHRVLQQDVAEVRAELASLELQVTPVLRRIERDLLPAEPTLEDRLDRLREATAGRAPPP